MPAAQRRSKGEPEEAELREWCLPLLLLTVGSALDLSDSSHDGANPFQAVAACVSAAGSEERSGPALSPARGDADPVSLRRLFVGHNLRAKSLPSTVLRSEVFVLVVVVFFWFWFGFF